MDQQTPWKFKEPRRFLVYKIQILNRFFLEANLDLLPFASAEQDRCFLHAHVPAPARLHHWTCPPVSYLPADVSLHLPLDKIPEGKHCSPYPP